MKQTYDKYEKDGSVFYPIEIDFEDGKSEDGTVEIYRYGGKVAGIELDCRTDQATQPYFADIIAYIFRKKVLDEEFSLRFERFLVSRGIEPRGMKLCKPNATADEEVSRLTSREVHQAMALTQVALSQLSVLVQT